MSAPTHERVRRRFRRSTVRLRVDYETASGARSGTATTLGIGGLFIATRDPLPVGTPLSLRFRVAGGDPHEIEGRVVWRHAADGHGVVRTCGMGVAFAPGGATARLARELEAG